MSAKATWILRIVVGSRPATNVAGHLRAPLAEAGAVALRGGHSGEGVRADNDLATPARRVEAARACRGAVIFFAAERAAVLGQGGGQRGFVHE